MKFKHTHHPVVEDIYEYNVGNVYLHENTQHPHMLAQGNRYDEFIIIDLTDGASYACGTLDYCTRYLKDYFIPVAEVEIITKG